MVFVCPGICPGNCHAVRPEISPTGKNIKKVMVSRNLRQAYLLKVGLTQIPVDHAPLSITGHVGLNVDFSSTNFSLGL